MYNMTKTIQPPQPTGNTNTNTNANTNTRKGLAKPSSNQGAPDYGLILNAFKEVLVIEAGNIIGIVSDYAKNDVFEVRIGPKGDVQYVRNDDVIQTSSVDVPSNGALEVDIALRGSKVGPILGAVQWIGKQNWCNQVECSAGTQCCIRVARARHAASRSVLPSLK